jgi:hypothetical protein
MDELGTSVLYFGCWPQSRRSASYDYLRRYIHSPNLSGHTPFTCMSDYGKEVNVLT